MEKNAEMMFQAGLPEMNEKETTAPVECDANSMEKSGKAKETSFSSFAAPYKADLNERVQAYESELLEKIHAYESALLKEIRTYKTREIIHTFHEIRKTAINNGLFDKNDYSKIKEYTKNFTARFILPAKDNADEKENVIETGTVGTTIYKIVKVEKITAKDIIASVNNLARVGIIRFGEKKELSEDEKIKVNTLVNTLRPVPETSWDQICAICKFGTRVKNAAYAILKAQ